MGDGSLEELEVWGLVYVGGGCRTLRPRVLVVWRVGLLNGTLQSCGPAHLRGSFLPGADTYTPGSPTPFILLRHPEAHQPGWRTLFSSSGAAPWTGSLIRGLLVVGKDPSDSPSAWAPPGGPQAPPWF